MSAKFNLPNLPAQPNFELPSFNTTQQPVDPAIDQVNNYLLASLRHENINDPSLQGIEKDVATLTPIELLVKYGNTTGSELIKRQATADANYIADRHQKRSTDEVIADTVSGVGKGIYNTFTGAVSLGLGMIPGAGDLSSAYSKAVEEGNQWIDSFDTEPLKNAKKAYQARQQVYDRASKYLFDEDIKNGVSPTRASLRRIGRDFTNIIKNETTDSAVMGNTLAQVTGSLMGAGAVSLMTRAGLSAAGIAKETVDRLAWPIAISATEGGGGLQQGYQEVINTPIESLRETVPEFDLLVQEKIDSGLSVEQAENAVREDLALAVGRRVGALSAAAGMALGKVSQSMESAITSPLVRVPGKVISARTGGELVEEGGIGATNALGTNLAIQQLVDANRDLSEGVGTELGSGALYGAASAGIVQAPQIALNTAETTVKTVGKGVSTLMDKAIASREAKAGHSPKSQQDSLKFLLAYQQALQAKQQESEQPLTNQEQVELNTLDSLNSTKVEGVESTKVNDVLNNSNNKVDALHNLDYQARKGNLTQEELDDNAIATVNLASDVIALQNTQKDLIAEEATENSTAVRDAVNNVYKDSKAKNIIRKSLDVVIGLANNSSDINTKAKATKAAIKAGLLGEISLETYKDILSAVDKNQIQLSDEDKDLITLAQTVMEEEHNLFEKQDKGDTFALESTAKVRHQLLMGLNEEYEKTKHYSLNQLLRKLVFAHQTKNTAEEADIITRINNLRLQQASKLEALQKSINAGGTINNTFTYQSLHPADNVLLPSDSDKLNLNNPQLGVTIGAVESEKLAKTIEKELEVLTNITNKIIDSKLFNPTASYLNLQKTTASKLNWNPTVNSNNTNNNNNSNTQQVVTQPSVQPQVVQQQPTQQQVVEAESAKEEELAPWEGEDTFNKEPSKETTTTTENTEKLNTPVEKTKTSNEDTKNVISGRGKATWKNPNVNEVKVGGKDKGSKYEEGILTRPGTAPDKWNGQKLEDIKDPEGGKALGKFYSKNGSEYVYTDKGYTRRVKFNDPETNGSDAGVNNWCKVLFLDKNDPMYKDFIEGFADKKQLVKDFFALNPVITKDGKIAVFDKATQSWRSLQKSDLHPKRTTDGTIKNENYQFKPVDQKPSTDKTLVEFELDEKGFIKSIHFSGGIGYVEPTVSKANTSNEKTNNDSTKTDEEKELDYILYGSPSAKQLNTRIESDRKLAERFPKAKAIEERMLADGTKEQPIITVVGSREVPKFVEVFFKVFMQSFNSHWFEGHDIDPTTKVTFRTGEAKGIDAIVREHYSTYNNNEIYYAKDILEDTFGNAEEAKKISGELHPVKNFEGFNNYTTALLSRNAYQVLGADLKTPSNLVIAYVRTDKNGNYIGGAAQTIKIAKAHGIPCIVLTDKNYKKAIIDTWKEDYDKTFDNLAAAINKNIKFNAPKRKLTPYEESAQDSFNFDVILPETKEIKEEVKSEITPEVKTEEQVQPQQIQEVVQETQTLTKEDIERNIAEIEEELNIQQEALENTQDEADIEEINYQISELKERLRNAKEILRNEDTTSSKYKTISKKFGEIFSLKKNVSKHISSLNLVDSIRNSIKSDKFSDIPTKLKGKFLNLRASSKYNATLKEAVLNLFKPDSRDKQNYAYKVKTQAKDYINAWLNSKNDEGITNKELILSGKGKDIQGHYLIPLLQRTPNGLEINNELLNRAVTASVSWFLQAKQGQRYRSSEDWQEFFKEDYGKPHLNSTIVNILNKSVFKQSSAESLAKKIQNYWGLKANDDASYRSANGIPLEMANLMLTAMQDTGMLKQHSIKRYDVDDNELPETITVFEHIDPDTNLNEGDQTKKNAIWLCPSILDDLVAVEKEYKIYIDETPELIINKLHSSDEITEKQKEQLKGMNAIEYYVDTEVTDFYEAIGEENFVKLFGLPPVKSDVANQETIAAVEGKNDNLRRSFREMKSYLQTLKTEYFHKSIDSIPRRFQSAITSVNRYQQLGSITPQGDKFMREWLSSTKSIIDLTKVNNREKYYRSIGQAFGIKIEKQDYKKTKNRVDEISKALEPSKQIIKNFLASRTREGELALNDNGAFKFTWAELESIKNNFDQFKVDFNHLSLKALVDLVRFENSSKEERSAYRTNLYVEADGVTNGVIMLLLNFMSGRIDAQTLFRLARGGVSFFGKKALQTLYTPSTYWKNTQDPKLDIYGLCAKAFSNSLGTIEDPVVKQMVTDFLHIGSLTVGKTKLIDGIGSPEDLLNDIDIQDWVIARNFTKNPTTTINYGSGHKSIAVKIKNQLVKNLYKGFTQAAIKMKANPKLTAVEAMFGDNSELSKQKMQALIDFLPPTFDKDKPSITNIADFKQADFAKFIFSANQEKEIVSVIDEAVTTQLKAEIEQNAIGQQIIDNLQAIQDATNIQAAIQKDLFIAEFNELWQKDFTVGEYKAFKAKNRAIGPVIYNGDNQVFNLSDDSQMRETEDDGISFVASKGLGKFDSGKQDNKLIGRNNLIRFPISMPTQPGVKSKPNLNIGFGDGMIMGKLANLTNCLHVHDGFNIRLQDLDEYSLLANKAVYDSIMEVNPYTAVLDSFNNTISLAQKYKKPLSKETIRTIANIRATSLEFESRRDRENFINYFTETDAFNVIDFLQNYLARTADSAKKLKETYKSVPMSIDQMAGLENPYTNKRNTKVFNSIEDVVNTINEKYDSIDNKDSYNRTVDTMGYTTNVFDFGDSLFKERTQKWVWNLVKKIKNLDNTAITFFNEKDFARVKAHYGITDKVSGFYVPNLNKIFILRKSEDFSKEAETILHEIFHAAITKKVINAQNGEVDSLSKQAYEQINKLRKQFVNMCYQEPRKMQALLKKAMVESGIAKSSEEINAKYDVVKNTFEFYLKEFNVDENNADAVMAANDEFITYILTKPFMTSLASNMEVKAEKNFFKRAFEKVVLFLWGPNQTFGQGKTLLSQIKFSVSVIVGESIQNENVTLGSSEVSIPPRLSKIPPQPLGQATINSNVTIDDVTQYSKLMATIYTALKKDSKLLPQLTDIYTKLSKKLTAKDFENATTSPLEAESKFDTVFGISLNKDEIIPNLLALSLTSKEVRDVLNTVDLDELIKDPSDGTLDNWLRKQGEVLVQKLQDKVAKISSTGETDQVIADLYQRLQQSNIKQKTMFTQIVDWDEKIVNVYQDINEGLVEILDDLGTKLSKKAEHVKNTSSNKTVKSIASVIKTLGLSFNPVMGEAAKTTFISVMNVFYNPNSAVGQQASGFYNLGLDIVGKFKGNAYIYNFIKKSKQKLQKARQYTRDYMPKLLRDCFSTDVSDEESTAMFKVIAKCDLEALSNYGLDTINNFINDKVKLNKELDRLTNSIQAIKSPVMTFDKQLALQKCAELAEFMLTGKAVDGQLKNADVIAYVSTSVDQKVPDSEVKEFRDSIAKILDKYTSLLALEKLDKETIKNWNRVFNEEKEGVKALYAIYGECKQEEKKKINDQIKYNVLKGYIPSEKVTQNTVVIANTSDDLILKQSGFTKVKDYVGSSKEVQQHKAYYVTKVNPKAIYNQGIMQLASMTAFGVDVSTGYSSQFTGGFTTKSNLIVEVEKEVYSKAKSNRAEGLIPVWKNGHIIALERSIDPEVYKEQLESSTNIFAMLPAWKGRQIEETNAYEHNMDCINRLYDGYKNDKDKNNNYVNIFEITDPVFKESLSLIPAEFKKAMKAKFGGENVFMVRKDLIRDIFGERSASIRDLFDGTGRINPKISNAVRRIIIALFGNKALVVTGEQAVMGTMAWARNNIVVRSVAVPIINIIGNIIHLMMRGIPLSYILKNIPKLIVESERYTKSELEIIDIDAKLSIHALNQAEREKLEARKKVLKHMQERLSIYPLIEQGEFGSIGDIGNTEEELGFISNKLVDSVKKAVDKLPDSVVSAGKYALISKDTALYQGLQKSVQYGDFFAKSIYYQYIMEHPEKYERFVPRLEADKRIRPLVSNSIAKYSKEGLKDLKQFALDRILEEFVDYDRQVGRTRQYMENIGLLWFYNFKIRSIKVMLSVIRENPLAAMLFIWAAPIVTPFGLLGTALTDNLIGKALQGDLGYTQGWDMLYNAPYMNPWISMIE